MRQRLSLAGQLLILQICIVVVVVIAVAAVSIAESDADFRAQEGARLRSVGENLAINPTVRMGLSSPVGSEALSSVAESARAVAGAGYVFITDSAGTLMTGPDSGRPAALAESTGLTGKSWIGVVDEGGRHLVAHVPVLHHQDGRLLGLVVVGVGYPTLVERLVSAGSDLMLYLALGLALGVAGSLLLARRVKRQTLGLEPPEITGLVEHREAMLHGIKEGVFGTDSADRVTLANEEALRLLGLTGDQIGRSLHSQSMDPHLRDVLTGKVTGTDRVVLSGDRIVVLNRRPVLVRDREVGAVTTLRDRTELVALQRELDISRHTTDTLRAQAHEFANRMHTIAGLLELGEHDEAIRYITRTNQVHEEFSRDVSRLIRDPAVAALLIAKASVAAEQHVRLRVTDDSDLTALDDELAADLGTILGNLIDNALDAVDAGGWVAVTVTADDDRLRARVSDSGDGVPAELADEVFRQGWTTKDRQGGHLGLGLALVGLICSRRGGGVSVSDAGFALWIPMPRREAP
ncbi:sensor histidine kinase regulating citrate/malate metabolism [Stackebrandtia albiflava]|uniref:histidine kinase n=1 Tax=Stackebrandtia albiflava TaxID=406432 RepID=A0A562V432_9ACTN|nr:ATP-binding protein [Stackebrandtia albiflava]TWJ12651.1 sensor histidine kinase regulating citrate/malate metabolism [Stackebrandtia albiflava]